MKVGEYLKSLLKRRRISIKQLADSMGLVSRNELYRLFNGYHAYDKQKQLIDAIVEVVDFTEEETAQIYNLLEEYKDGEFAYEARRILMNIFTSDIKGYRAEHHGTTKKLTEMLQSRSGKKIILMHGIRDLRIIQDVYDYLKIRPNQTLYHYLRLPSEDVLTAYELLALIKLSAFSGYKPMLVESNMPDGLYIIGKAANGAGYYQFIDFTEDKPRIIETPISDSLYEYLTQKNSTLELRSKPFVKTINGAADYMSLIDTAEKTDGDVFSCEGAPRFEYPASDILFDTLEGTNEYPPEHEYPQIPADIENMHWHKLLTTGSRKIFFDKRHIDEFLYNRYTADRAAQLTPLSPERRIRYLTELIERSSAPAEKMCFRMLKEEYVIDYPFTYVTDNALYIYRSGTDNTDESVIAVDNKNAVEAMRYFTEYIWESCTVSEEDTISCIKEKISEYADLPRNFSDFS